MAEDQQERQTDLWSAYAAEGISSTSLSDRDQEIRELRQHVQDLTGVLEAISLTQRQLSEREARSDWFSSTLEELARRLVARRGVDQNPCGGQLVGRCKIIVEFLAGSGSLGCSFQLSSGKWDVSEPCVSWVLCKLPDVEEGCSEMEDDH